MTIGDFVHPQELNSRQKNTAPTATPSAKMIAGRHAVANRRRGVPDLKGDFGMAAFLNTSSFFPTAIDDSFVFEPTDLYSLPRGVCAPFQRTWVNLAVMLECLELKTVKWEKLTIHNSVKQTV